VSHRVGQGHSPGAVSRGGGHDRLVRVVCVARSDDAQVRIGAVINWAAPKCIINIHFILECIFLISTCLIFYTHILVEKSGQSYILKIVSLS
jgi:hypothetical protein